DSGVDDCSDSATLVYVLDAGGKLSSFKPDTITFTDVGMVICPASVGSSPYSMAVDRNAIAWIVYTSGELFRVDTRSAACAPTTFQPGQQGLDVFGMGFSSNSPGSRDETLFLAGGSWQNSTGPVYPASLAFPSLVVGNIGFLRNWAEMTGRGDAT